MNKNIDSIGKVAVLMGGLSSEREVSLNSGFAVLQALKSLNIDAEGIDLKNLGLDNIIQLKYFDKIFIALHGGYGENGQIQALLNLLNIPYTGSGVAACALAMDKLRTKIIWDACGVLTPPYIAFIDGEVNNSIYDNKLRTFNSESIQYVVDHIQLPVIVKPNFEGSTIGITKVYHLEQLQPAYELAKSYSHIVLVEKLIEGSEYTVPVLNDKVLPIIKIQAPDGNYDYHYKYSSNETKYLCPSGLSAEQEMDINKHALAAFKILGADTWGRLDFMQDSKSGKFYFLELNTVPGMTSHSLVPMSAANVGINFTDLCLDILYCAKVK